MPAGTLFVVIATPNGEILTHQLIVVGDRRTMKERAAFTALGTLWREMIKHNSDHR
jgi:nicotinamide mononucleotide (NMN) deamidase PncC